MEQIGSTPPRALVALAMSACVFAIIVTRASAAGESTEAERRCGRAVLAARAHVQTNGTRTLSRCALAVLSARRAGEIDEVCRRLRTRLVGLDLADRRARKRVTEACTGVRPAWIATRCTGIGPWSGRDLETPEELAGCVVGTSHCWARASIEALVGPLEESVGVDSPENLLFEYGGIAGNSLDSCKGTPAPSTSTTTTTSITSTSTTTTTSTLVAGPTTTVPLGPTTTLTTPTTTLPVPTTLPPDTTTTTTSTSTTSLPLAGPPNLAITEIMVNPAALADSVGEYFEIKNLDLHPVDLVGLVVRDRGANRFTVTTPASVLPGGYFVFVRNAAAAAGHGDYAYGTAMSLGNESDAIILEFAGVILDEVAYDASYPLAEGRSLELSPSNESDDRNDDPTAWCASSSPLVGGDFGSPGERALGCAP